MAAVAPINLHSISEIPRWRQISQSIDTYSFHDLDDLYDF